MKKKVLSILFLYVVIQSNLFAQELVKTFPEQPWEVIQLVTDKNNVVIAQNEAIFSIAMKKKQNGIACMNDKGVIKWITNLDDKPEWVSIFGKNILVVFFTDKSYKATLIRPSDGKIIASKYIYTPENDYYQTVSFFSGNNGEFFKLSLRFSPVKKGVKIVPFYIGMKKILQNLQKYTRIETLSLTEDLNIATSETIDASGNNLSYLSSVCDSKGNITIGSYDNNSNKLIFNKYRAGNEKPAQSIAVAIEPRNDDAVKSFTLQQSSLNDDIVFLGMRYKNDDKDYILDLSRLDFKTGKYASSKDILDKKYLKDLEKSFSPVSKDDDRPDMKDLDTWLNVEKIHEQEDKIIVCKESATMYPRTSASSSDSYRWDSGIISIYDNNLKKVSEQVISNDYNNFIPEGGGFEYRIDKNKMLLVGNHEYHYGYYHTYIWEINIVTGKLEKKVEIEKEGLKKISFIKPTSTIWFKNNFILTYSVGKNETVFKMYK